MKVKARLLERMAAQAGLIVALISITSAIVVATRYFATREQLANVQDELTRQRKENECRTWLIRNILDHRIGILEKEDRYALIYDQQDALRHYEKKLSGRGEQPELRQVKESNKELIRMQAELDLLKTEEHKLRFILEQPTVLDESGACKAGD